MRAVVILLTISFTLGFIGWVWHNEGESIKALAGMDGKMASKSIMEDVAYWCWPSKWEQMQQERLDAQYERALEQEQAKP
jgi:hypothetical protein